MVTQSVVHVCVTISSAVLAGISPPSKYGQHQTQALFQTLMYIASLHATSAGASLLYI